MDFRQFKYFWGIAFFGWAILLFIASVMPTSGIEAEGGRESDFRWDYPAHLIVFIVFSLLYGYWRNSLKGRIRKKEILWFLVAGSAYAGLTESVQLFVDGRSFNPVDLLLNILGVLAGTLLAKLFIMRPDRDKSEIT